MLTVDKPGGAPSPGRPPPPTEHPGTPPAYAMSAPAAQMPTERHKCGYSELFSLGPTSVHTYVVHRENNQNLHSQQTAAKWPRLHPISCLRNAPLAPDGASQALGAAANAQHPISCVHNAPLAPNGASQASRAAANAQHPISPLNNAPLAHDGASTVLRAAANAQHPISPLNNALLAPDGASTVLSAAANAQPMEIAQSPQKAEQAYNSISARAEQNAQSMTDNKGLLMEK